MFTQKRLIVTFTRTLPVLFLPRRSVFTARSELIL